jgi:hypothetical protein
VATVLYNVLSFTNLVVGVAQQAAHGLQLDLDSAGVRPLTPQLVVPDRHPFTVAVDATNVTVTRTLASPGAAVDVWVQWSHTIEQVWPRTGLPAALPHIVQAGDVNGGNGTFLNVATVAELGAVNVTNLDDGSVAYVRSMDDLYTLTKTGGPYVADNLSIVDATPAGYWLAQVQGRWDDLMGAPDIGNRANALTQEVFRDTPLLLLFFRHDQDDSLHFVYQLPHKWRTTTAVHPHLHVMPMSDPAVDEVAYFSGQYTWAPRNFAPVPANAGWTPFNASLTISNGDIYRHMTADLGTFAAPANPTPSTCLFLYVEREGTNILDTYDTNKGAGTPAANLALLSSDLHYRAQHFGTLTEFV